MDERIKPEPWRLRTASSYIVSKLSQEGRYDVEKLAAEQDLGSLMPKYMLLLRDASWVNGEGLFHASEVVQQEGERPTLLLYPDSIPKEFGVERPNLFYFSNSHAVWRAALANKPDGWMAKGMFGTENSADAPIALQKAFSQLAALKPRLTTRLPILSMTDTVLTYAIAQARSQAEFVMSSHGVNADNAVKIGNDKGEELFVDGKRPDFSAEEDSWTQDIRQMLNAEVKSTVYPSEDGEVRYIINQTRLSDGEPTVYWIGTAEVISPELSVGSLGLPNIFPIIPDRLLETPITHDPRRDGGYKRSSDSTVSNALAALAGEAGKS